MMFESTAKQAVLDSVVIASAVFRFTMLVISFTVLSVYLFSSSF